MAYGHANAMKYPLWMVSAHVRATKKIVNTATATEAILVQLAAGSIMSKEMGKAFSEQIKDLIKG